MPNPDAQDNFDPPAAEPLSVSASSYPTIASSLNDFKSAVQDARKDSLGKAEDTVRTMFDGRFAPVIQMPGPGNERSQGAQADVSGKAAVAQASSDKTPVKVNEKGEKENQREKEGPGGSRLTYDNQGRLESIQYRDSADRQMKFHYDKNGELDRLDVLDKKGSIQQTRTKVGADQWNVKNGDGSDAGTWSGSIRVTPDGNLIQQTSKDKQEGKTRVQTAGLENYTEKTSSDGRLTTRTYRDLSQMETARDGNGDTTSITTRNKDGKVTKMEFPGVSSTEFNYDKNGKLERQIQKGPTGKVTKETSADGKSTDYAYDQSGQLISKTSKEKDGRITNEENADGSQIEYKYDKTGKLDRKVSIDKDNRITKEDHSDGGQTIHKYDKNGQLDSMVSNDKTGKFIKEEFRDGSRIENLYDKDGKPDGSVVKDKAGQILIERNGNGNETTHKYDKAGNPAGKTTTDKSGKVLREELADGKATSFDYDKNGKVISRVETDKDGKTVKDWTPAKELAAEAKEIVRVGVRSHEGHTQVRKMWEHAKELGGDPAENVTKALNDALKDVHGKYTTERVTVVDSASKDAPKVSFSNKVEALLIYPPGPSPKQSGSGIIGLGAAKK